MSASVAIALFVPIGCNSRADGIVRMRLEFVIRVKHNVPKCIRGVFFCSRFGLIVVGFTTIQSKGFVVNYTWHDVAVKPKENKK